MMPAKYGLPVTIVLDGGESRRTFVTTWCMAKNSPAASARPVYHGRIARVVKMRNKNSKGARKTPILVLR